MRIQPDRQVERVADAWHQQGMQALNDHDFAGLHALRPFQGPVAVVVDRLIDRLPALERPDLLLHERKVVGPWVECRQSNQRALPSIERVVVVEADRGDSLGAKQVEEPRGQRRLPGAAVATNSNEDRSLPDLCHHVLAPTRSAPTLTSSSSSSWAKDCSKSSTPVAFSSSATHSILTPKWVSASSVAAASSRASVSVAAGTSPWSANAAIVRGGI